MRIKTVGRSVLYSLFDGGECLISDVLPDGDYLATGKTIVVAEDENAYVGALAEHVGELPELPDSGWLEQGAIYAWNGTAVMVRQPHWRTIYPPSETLNLFVTYRPDAANLEWLPAETVVVGTRRTYGGKLYECLQGHVTQSDWTPPVVPALWKEIVEEPPTNEWTAGVAYKIGDVVTYQGKSYQCRQAHTSIASWTPPVVLALWLPL